MSTDGDDYAQEAVDAAEIAASRHPSDKPIYRATPQEAIKRYFTKYAVFHGRASRSEFWWAATLAIVIFLAVGIAVEMVNAVSDPSDPRPTPASTAIGIVYLVYALATLVPSVAVFVRRLHDANLSGWWALLAVIPFFGSVIAIIFAVLPKQGYGKRFDRV